MDLASIAIGAIFLAAFIVPFIWMGYNRKNKEKQDVLQFQKFAKDHSFELTEVDVMSMLMIGMDQTKTCLFFAYKEDEKWQYNFFKYADISTTKIHKVSNTVSTANGNVEVVKKLQLLVSSKLKEHAPIAITFFDQSKSMELDDEMQLIQKWQKLL